MPATAPSPRSGTRAAARVAGVAVYTLPVMMRVPLKFGNETVRSVGCCRVKLVLEDRTGRRAAGWGETPLNLGWAWPSGTLSVAQRSQRLHAFVEAVAQAWAAHDEQDHAFVLGWSFLEHVLPALRSRFPDVPELATLVAASAFDLALHDAFGGLLGRPVWDTFDRATLPFDLATFVRGDDVDTSRFAGRFIGDLLDPGPPTRLPVWHLVGGLDPLGDGERSGDEPDDGHPLTLPRWIARDGLRCLKIKLRGNDAGWDLQRLRRVGEIAIAHRVDWLSADFNCTVREPAYVADVIDRLRAEAPRIFGMLLYVEQPFGYDLAVERIDVHDLAWRKPILLDESAHDWRAVALGRSLGWNGVALKTCKTLTGALLSLAYARAHGMAVMVQDLTNPMLAMVPHAALAARVHTLMGVESNAPQYYPAASAPEAVVHPGLYRRRDGVIDLGTLGGPGFGYRLEAIDRTLPAPSLVFGDPSC